MMLFKIVVRGVSVIFFPFQLTFQKSFMHLPVNGYATAVPFPMTVWFLFEVLTACQVLFFYLMTHLSGVTWQMFLEQFSFIEMTLVSLGILTVHAVNDVFRVTLVAQQ